MEQNTALTKPASDLEQHSRALLPAQGWEDERAMEALAAEVAFASLIWQA